MEASNSSLIYILIGEKNGWLQSIGTGSNNPHSIIINNTFHHRSLKDMWMTLESSFIPIINEEKIGTKLLKASISLAKKRRFKDPEIVTFAENKTMRRAAEKARFHLEGNKNKKAINFHGKLRDENIIVILL